MKPGGYPLVDGVLGSDGGFGIAAAGGGVVAAGVVGVAAGAGVVTAGVVLAVLSLLSSLENTPPMARPPTIRAISTTAASAIQGAFDPPLARCGGPPIGPPA